MMTASYLALGAASRQNGFHSVWPEKEFWRRLRRENRCMRQGLVFRMLCCGEVPCRGERMKLLLQAAFTAAFVVSQCLGQAAAADAYPSKPVRIIVGYSPGTTSDVFARMIAQKL